MSLICPATLRKNTIPPPSPSSVILVESHIHHTTEDQFTEINPPPHYHFVSCSFLFCFFRGGGGYFLDKLFALVKAALRSLWIIQRGRSAGFSEDIMFFNVILMSQQIAFAFFVFRLWLKSQRQIFKTDKTETVCMTKQTTRGE